MALRKTDIIKGYQEIPDISSKRYHILIVINVENQSI